MFPCLIIGDSIGYGVSQIRKDCTAYVQSGINSRDWNKKFSNKPMGAKVVVISLGSNDYRGLNTREQLEYIRSAVDSADRVLWILPANKVNIRDLIISIAENYGDDYLEMVSLSPDGVHPTPKGYHAIAKQF